MAKLTHKKQSTVRSVIVYGAPKSGKSLLAAKLAEHFNLLWFDLENGYEVMYQLPEEWQERVEVISIPDTRSFPIAIETCLKVVKGAVSICEAHGKVGCMICKKAEMTAAEEDKADFFTNVDVRSLDTSWVVVFDSLTQLSNSAIAHITKSQPDDYKLDYDDWGNLGKLLDIFLSHIQQAGYNVVVISHEQEIETEGKSKQLMPVGGTRNYSRNVAKHFGHVVYMERKNKKHVATSSTTASTSILAGSRTGVMLEDGEATLLEIFKPELYADKAKSPISSGSPVAATSQVSSQVSTSSDSPAKGVSTTASATSDILARLRANKK